MDEDVLWAADAADGMAVLLVNMLLNHGQQLVYLRGMAVNGASAGYRGMGKIEPTTPPPLRTRPGCAGTWRFCSRATNMPIDP
ncbi:hypothetical protein ABZV60_35135 [Streptomyces sp. NPDC004787]|uniref:hypothetical protein n=1 Tax=Streptomyces sp. NPDC004787 TaxID=3154291 RepID=UPI0033BD4B56